MSNPFFSIVTPVFNGETHIEETIKSVLSQSIDDYEYTIVDNMSTDNTRNIINKYSSNITKIISEKDDGMYDALNKGFASSRGKYFLWLNSDDFLKNKDVLKKVKNYLEKNPHARWIIGNTSFKYEKFDFSLTFFPYQYPQAIITSGFAHNCGWGFIQQESTIFNRKSFNDLGGFDSNNKMAGDFHFWKKLALKEKLISVNISIGVQRKWEGQLQNNLDFYFKEINKKKCKFPILKIFRFVYSFVLYIKFLIFK